MKWLNEPPEWSEDNGILYVTTGPNGDFWRRTHYGFIHNDGHFAYEDAEGEFTATVCVESEFGGLYDQAGLMLRLDDENWIKAGIEYVNGTWNFSVVVTHQFSDWSIRPWTTGSPVWLRFIRRGDAIAIQSSPDGETWSLVRLAYFPPDIPVQVGPMTCSPMRECLEVKFSHRSVGPLVEFEA